MVAFNETLSSREDLLITGVSIGALCTLLFTTVVLLFPMARYFLSRMTNDTASDSSEAKPRKRKEPRDRSDGTFHNGGVELRRRGSVAENDSDDDDEQREFVLNEDDTE